MNTALRFLTKGCPCHLRKQVQLARLIAGADRSPEAYDAALDAMVDRASQVTETGLLEHFAIEERLVWPAWVARYPDIAPMVQQLLRTHERHRRILASEDRNLAIDRNDFFTHAAAEEMLYYAVSARWNKEAA